MSLYALLVPAWACAGSEGGDGKDPGSGNGNGDSADESILGPDGVVMDDTSAGLEIDVQGGTATSWLFGAIEPRVDMYEEACRDEGDICHTLAADGGVLDWVNGCGDNADGRTCIPQLYWRQGQMSFVIEPAVGFGCWAWGDAAADYYEGCTVTGWETDSY